MKKTQTHIQGFLIESEQRGPDRRTALFSPDRIYRYALERWWGEGTRRLVVIGLNPSTANESIDDPTIRRCIRFAKRERCDGLVMLNLFGLRATDPRELRLTQRPIGPENDKWLASYVTAPGFDSVVLAAWGDPGIYHSRAADVANWLRANVALVHCLGRTKHLHPRHPLYVRADAPLLTFSTSAAASRTVSHTVTRGANDGAAGALDET